MITLKHYKTDKIKNNWKVLLDNKEIGSLHDCDGIGGYIGKHTDTELFDEVCELAQEELKEIR